MIQGLSAVFWGVVTFSILVVLHEGGHFAMARVFGVKVHEFMIGLPGPAIRLHGKKTTYGITAIPLGGYVRIAGMEPGPEDALLADALAFVARRHGASVADVSETLGVDSKRAESLLATLDDWDAVSLADDADASGAEVFLASADAHVADDPKTLLDAARSQTYRGLPTWKRVVLLSAGVVVNLVSAILVFVLVLTLYGVPTATLKVEALGNGSAAAIAGIKPGDTVKAFGSETLKDWTALIDALASHKPGDKVTLTVTRGGVDRVIPVILGAAPDGRARLGVRATSENVHLSVTAALKDSFTWIGLVFKAIGGFFNPQTFKTSVSQSSSVVGISVEVARAVQRGPIDYAFIVALLSLSLGVMNILPIPPLDGGKIAVEVIERVVGRPLSRKLSLGLSAAGALLLFTFIGYLMYADVVRYVVKGG